MHFYEKVSDTECAILKITFIITHRFFNRDLAQCYVSYVIEYYYYFIS